MPVPSNAYRLSGKPGLALVVVPPVAVVAAVVLGIVYAYLDVYIPIAGIFTLFLVLGFGFAVGFTVGAVGRATHCRSRPFLGVVGLAAGLLALYVSWAAFEHALIARHESEAPGLVPLLLTPSAVWAIATSVSETGWYSIAGGTPSGGVLWVLWGIEAIMVVAIAALGAPAALDSDVYCERCRKWVEPDPSVRLGSPGDAETLARRVAAGEVAALEALPTAGPLENPHLRVDVRACGGCASTAAFKVDAVRFETDKKGKVEEKTAALVRSLVVSPEDVCRLRDLARRPPAPVAAPAIALKAAPPPPAG